MTFYAKVLLTVGGLVAAAALLIFLLASSEEKTIENVLREGVRAAERGDAEAVIALLSRSYQAPDQDYEAAVRRIRAEVVRAKGLTLELAGAQIRVEGEEADADVLVRVKAGPRPLGDAGLRLRLKKEGGAWKVIRGEEVSR